MTRPSGENPTPRPRYVGRATCDSPPNRFEKQHVVDDFEHVPSDAQDPLRPKRVATQTLVDESRQVITQNDSPDVGFSHSVNPYRGCEHGCAYCYARVTHEYLGMNAGLDFDSKIVVKYDVAKLLRKELAHPRWAGETIVMSGATDPYQPLERRLRLTRQCLEVMLEARQRVGIITKNALVARDLELLKALAAENLVQVNMSITSLDPELIRGMEPRTSRPQCRLKAIQRLSEEGVPVRVMVAPIIPGLNDEEMPAILKAAADAGARSASYIVLRLPQSVGPVFESWLRERHPLAAERILGRIRGVRSGNLSDPRFHQRMRGQGPYAEQIAQAFRVFARSYGLDQPLPPLDGSKFRPPTAPGAQQMLF